jgi:hypothetical protein
MSTREDIERMIADVETCHDDLSDWEQSFI